MQKTLLKTLAWLIVLIFLLNFLAIFFFHWYWTIWWFDILMHFLGGMWVSLAILWLFYGRFVSLITNRKIAMVFVLVFLAVLVVALLWEVFEFSVDTFITLRRYDQFDTISDILLGLAGGMTGILYFVNKITKKQEHKPNV